MNEPPLHSFVAGNSPLLINVPHAGTFVPTHLRERMTAAAQSLPDTDWHVEKLYGFALACGAGLMVATHSRYVVDLNRDPRGQPLYPGADNTEICPATTFANEAIWLPGAAPTVDEVLGRCDQYWQPYHAALQDSVDAVAARHGHAILLDAHSIRAQVPRFFDGHLPDLNLGTADGASCAGTLQAAAASALLAHEGFTSIVNGRFKGGYITRHFGRPQQSVHALQLEIAQACYMDERPPYLWNAPRAQPLIKVLRCLIDSLLDWRD